jgi:magnesium-transporting ATPase (P-type)
MNITGLQSLAGFVKVVIYLAVIAVLVAIVYVLGSFIYVMANANDLSRVAVTNLYKLPAFVRDHGPGVWEAANGGVRFRLLHVYGEFSYLNMPRAMVLAIFFRLFVQCALFFIGVVQMANVFEDVSQGRPFVKENARRLRIVGYAMAGGAIFKFVVQMSTLFMFKDAIAIPGTSIPWYWLLKETLSLGLLLGGLVVLVISEVFRLGNRLEEEQELTI